MRRKNENALLKLKCFAKIEMRLKNKNMTQKLKCITKIKQVAKIRKICR